MRRLLGLLRTADDRPDVRDPQQGLDDIETLLSQVREAGLHVRLTVEGTPRPLPAGLDLSAFRIVQEALTNVLKHAGPATATVRIRYERSRLHLDDLRQRLESGRTGPGSAPGAIWTSRHARARRPLRRQLAGRAAAG